MTRVTIQDRIIYLDLRLASLAFYASRHVLLHETDLTYYSVLAIIVAAVAADPGSASYVACGHTRKSRKTPSRLRGGMIVVVVVRKIVEKSRYFH